MIDIDVECVPIQNYINQPENIASLFYKYWEAVGINSSFYQDKSRRALYLTNHDLIFGISKVHYFDPAKNSFGLPDDLLLKATITKAKELNATSLILAENFENLDSREHIMLYDQFRISKNIITQAGLELKDFYYLSKDGFINYLKIKCISS